MDYCNPQLRRALAAEYVVGTLRGAARCRFERVLAREPSVRAEVYFWERCFSEMTEAVPPVEPPPTAWAYLRGCMRPATALTTQRPRARHPAQVRRTRILGGGRSWRIVVGMATAATLFLAIWIGQSRVARPIEAQHGSPGRHAPAVSTAQSPAAPLFVTLLRVPTSNVEWLVSLSPDQRQINIVAAGDYPRLGQRKVQLWLISPSSGRAVALGVLPSRAGGSVDINLPSALGGDVDSGFDLAVSLEPEQSSPHDLPDGPVVTWARNLTAQRDNQI